VPADKAPVAGECALGNISSCAFMGIVLSNAASEQKRTSSTKRSSSSTGHTAIPRSAVGESHHSFPGSCR
jgi:hypothetical protein